MEPTLAQQLLDTLQELDSETYPKYDLYTPIIARTLVGILQLLEEAAKPILIYEGSNE